MPAMHRSPAVVFLVLLVPVSLFAQDLESFGGLRLRFDAPGARTAAMGGASEALSDAFAGAANPASLARQRTRVLAIETREIANETDYLTGGTVGAFTSSAFGTTSRGVAGAAIVIPARAATWAFHYDRPLHVSADTRALTGMSNRIATMIAVGVRDGQLVPAEECVDAECTFAASFAAPVLLAMNGELRLQRYGVAAARSFGRLALGASAQYAQLDESLGLAGVGQEASDAQPTWNAGLQLELTSRLRLGGSFRGGASFEAERVVLTAGNTLETQPAQFRTPSSYAAGIAADVTPNLTVAADAVRVRYSEMVKNRSFGPPAWLMPDVTELRAGAEYRFRTRIPVALRAGWWHEPAHRLRAGDDTFGSGKTLNAIMLLDQDETHVTAGIGVGDRVRLDAAYDRSENTSRASLALAATF
jgi:hypothetical protein